MNDHSKSVRRAEIALILLFVLAILIPQIVGGNQGKESSASKDISSLDDLQNATFAVVLGSAYDLMITDLFPNAEKSYVTDWATECLQVQQGKADAVLWEASSLNEVQEEYPDLTWLPEAVGDNQFSWCTQKTARGKKILSELNEFIAFLQDQNLLDEIYHRWEDPETAPDHVESFPKTGADQGPLKMVSCLDWQPICYLNGENPCGYMIELFYRFCAWAGYDPVEEYVDVGALEAGFGAGKYDLLVYGMFYQEEAAEHMYYSEALIHDPIYVLVSRNRYARTDSASSGESTDFLSRLKNSLIKNFVREDRWKMLLNGLGITVGLSVLSILLGTVLGGIICAMRMSRQPLLCAFGRIWIRVLQGMPIVLMLLILYYIVFGSITIPPFYVCVLAFMLDFSAYASEMFRSGIQAVPEGQKRAAIALGFTPFEAFRHVVFPQMTIHCLPVYMGQVISTVKLTSVAGYISVMDLTRVSDLIRSRTYEAFFPLIVTALIYFLVAWMLTLILKWLEKKIDPALRKRVIKGVNLHVD